jgi:hypothetical protein
LPPGVDTARATGPVTVVAFRQNRAVFSRIERRPVNPSGDIGR